MFDVQVSMEILLVVLGVLGLLGLLYAMYRWLLGSFYREARIRSAIENAQNVLEESQAGRRGVPGP